MQVVIRTGRAVMAAAAIALAVGGTVAIAVGCSAQQTPPQPHATAAAPVATAPPTPTPTSGGPEFTVPGGPKGLVLSQSVPTSIDIPAIGVHSTLMKLGQQSNGSIEVPPLGRNSVAGWYDKSPSPGQLGPSIVLGHVDSKAYGPAVFFRLGALKPGDRVSIGRSDGLVALFRVDRVAEYAKTKFPSQEVYGNIDHAGLRLITCGGTFNPSARSYDDNIVVYGSLVGTTHTA